MQKIELTISPNYVPTWGIVEAIRELFQNALDQETQCPGNDMEWAYDEDEQKLTISNKTSVLTASTLLLGTTTKAGDASTIGQFGEGYKIATLVLLRNNKQITFYNYGAKEIWRPRFVKSRRFGTDVLTFFIEKIGLWNTVPDANLTIEITGITRSEWENEIIPSNLHLQHGVDTIEANEYGEVIDQPGRVYVNGLFVCEYEPYKYGYNFKPEHLRLDRDRKMVSDFDLRWAASKLWSYTENTDKVLDLLEQGAADVAYIDSASMSPTMWRDAAARRFRDVYGPEAIPITSQEELDAVPQGYKGIIVPRAYSEILSTRISVPEPTSDSDDPKDKLQELFDELVLRYNISDEDVEAFNEIMEDL